MSTNKPWRAGLLASALMWLVGCGGGGGDAVTDAPPVAVGQAWHDLWASDRAWVFEGTDFFGRAARMERSQQHLPDAVFPVTGALAGRLQTVDKHWVDGVLIGSDTVIWYLDRTSGARIGTMNANSECLRDDNPVAPPATAVTGDSGLLASSVAVLNGCTAGAQQINTMQHRWSLIEDSGLRYLCLRWTIRSLDGAATVFEETCHEVDAAGALGSRARVITSLTESGREFRQVVWTGG